MSAAADAVKDVGAFGVCVLLCGVEISTDATWEENGFLSDECDAVAQGLRVDLCEIDVIDCDAAGFWTNGVEQGQG